MENKQVARILRDTAQLLEIDGAQIGRYRSYEKVAELLYSIHERIEDIAKDDKKLKELPGVGDNMAEHIHEILRTGDYSLRQKTAGDDGMIDWTWAAPQNAAKGTIGINCSAGDKSGKTSTSVEVR